MTFVTNDQIVYIFVTISPACFEMLRVSVLSLN